MHFVGENIEPFCKEKICGIEVRYGAKVHNKCVPVYYPGQNPAKTWFFAFECRKICYFNIV